MVSETQDEMRERILRGAARCIERWSVSKATLSDVAEEAGVSRATLYRTFPGGRDELLQELVGYEMRTFFGDLARYIEDSGDLSGRLVDGLMYAHRMLADHSLYQRVLATEPDLLLPLMTVESTRIRELISGYLRPYVLEEGAPDDVETDSLCDYLARMVLSFIETPGGWDMTDRPSVEQLVESRFMGAVHHAAR